MEVNLLSTRFPFFDPVISRGQADPNGPRRRGTSPLTNVIADSVPLLRAQHLGTADRFAQARDSLGGLLSNLNALAKGTGALQASLQSAGGGNQPLDSQQIDGVVASAKGFVDQANKYLESLNPRAGENAKQGGQLAQDFLAAFGKDNQAAAAVGVSVQDGHLALDETALRSSLATTPGQTLSTFDQLQKSLQSPLDSQQSLAEDLRRTYQAMGQQAPQLSHSTYSMFRVDQEHSRVSSLFRSIDKSLEGIKRQGASLDKQPGSAEGAKAAELKDKDAEKPKTATAPVLTVSSSPRPFALIGQGFGSPVGAQGFGGSRYGVYDGGA